MDRDREGGVGIGVRMGKGGLSVSMIRYSRVGVMVYVVRAYMEGVACFDEVLSWSGGERREGSLVLGKGCFWACGRTKDGGLC